MHTHNGYQQRLSFLQLILFLCSLTEIRILALITSQSPKETLRLFVSAFMQSKLRRYLSFRQLHILH
jgi:hypothetical protein